MNKQLLVTQLADRLRNSTRIADRAGEASAEEARTGATPAERREDSRVALENSRMAKAQIERADRHRAELAKLEAFHPAPTGDAIALGSIVEVEDEDGGGRTFFLAPVGAGEELRLDGDGFLSVVTPYSPIGRAVLGRRVGDTVDVVVNRQSKELTITYVG